MTAVIVFCALSLLLICGKLLRSTIPLFQRLYPPSSVIGGLLGLVLISCLGSHIPPEWVDVMKKVPGFLINVIFATLFLGVVTPSLGKIVKIALPQLCLGQIMAWGQYVVGLGLAGFLLCYLFDVPAVFGTCWRSGFRVDTAPWAV